MSEELENMKYGLLFDVRRSVRYHTYRRRFFDNFQTVATAISAIAGAATTAAALSSIYKDYSIYTGVLITVLQMLNLVIRSTDKSKLHTELARRFLELEKKIIIAKPYSEENIDDWTTERLTIEADEPPIKRVLDSICYNEMLQSMGHDKEEVRIGFVQRLLSQFVDISPHVIRRK